MSRNLLAIASLTSIAVLAIMAPAARATDSIPSYFFNDWTIDTNCVEVGDDADDHAHQGLKFRISQASLSSGDQSYAFETVNNGTQVWDSSWASVRLQYRAGTQMAAVPADFACVPGEEASSTLLAMTGFSQSTEPYYEYEHWYGVATIDGAPHHVLIFPRSATGDSSVVMVLENATSDSHVQLDQNGTIHGHDH